MANNGVKIVLVGGLGNQLFGYFFGRQLERQTGKRIEFDVSSQYYGMAAHEVSIQDLKLPGTFSHSRQKPSLVVRIGASIHRRALPFLTHLGLQKHSKVYRSLETGYDDKALEAQGKSEFRGYFQSWKYLEGLDPIIFSDFFAPRNPSKWYLSALEEVERQKPIAIHVRRGDYKSLTDVFGLLSEEYYLSALKALSMKVGDAPIWVFSDDIGAAKVMLNPLEVSSLNFVLPPPESSSVESLLIMSKCRALIMANSTFSWWAGYLMNQPGSVIAPTPFFKNLQEPRDFIPQDWLRLGSTWV